MDGVQAEAKLGKHRSRCTRIRTLDAPAPAPPTPAAMSEPPPQGWRRACGLESAFGTGSSQEGHVCEIPLESIGKHPLDPVIESTNSSG